MPRKVLLVDDSPAISKLIRILMMGANLDFYEANDANRALQLIRLVQFDLVISDVNMPDVDGLELIKRIRADERNAGLKILLLTGEKTPFLRQRALEAGAIAVLDKPVTAPTIREAIWSALAITPPTKAKAPP